MQISSEGKKLIQDLESLNLEAYRDGKDKDGNYVYSIGWGHRDKTIKPKDKITRTKAQQFFDEDIKTVEDAIERLVKVPLAQHEYDAICSFIYNIGQGRFEDSKVLIRLNQGDRIPAADHMLRWDKVDGEVNGWQVRRRHIEKAIFKGYDYETAVKKGDAAHGDFKQGL